MMQAAPAPSPPVIDRPRGDTNGENRPSEENADGMDDDRSLEGVNDPLPDTEMASTSRHAQPAKITALPGIRDLFPGRWFALALSPVNFLGSLSLS